MLFGKLKSCHGTTCLTMAKKIRLISINYPDLSESLVKTIQESLLLSTACYIIFLTRLLKEKERMST